MTPAPHQNQNRDRNRRALALDAGEQRIGVAVSDESGTIATPLIVLPRQGLEAALQGLLNHWQPVVVVVGLPASMSGREGAQARTTRADIAKLMAAMTGAPPVEFWDERLTTVMADRMLHERGANRKDRKLERDAIAAAIILQGWLDARWNARQREDRRRQT